MELRFGILTYYVLLQTIHMYIYYAQQVDPSSDVGGLQFISFTRQKYNFELMKTMESAVKNVFKWTENLIFSWYLLEQVSSNFEINFLEKKYKKVKNRNVEILTRKGEIKISIFCVLIALFRVIVSGFAFFDIMLSCQFFYFMLFRPN